MKSKIKLWLSSLPTPFGFIQFAHEQPEVKKEERSKLFQIPDWIKKHSK